MPRLHRLSVIVLYSVAVAGCGGSNVALPHSAPTATPAPTATATPTSAPNSAALRFVQGSPDVGSVDVCVDSTAASTATGYKGFSGIVPIVGNASHVLSVYAAPATATPGTECATAPQSFLGAAPLATTTFTIPIGTRAYMVLGGRTGSSFGLFYFPSPTSFVHSPTAPEALLFNASPTFGNVGFGYSDASLTRTISASLVAPVASSSTATVSTAGSSSVVTPFTMQNIGSQFYVGKPVTSGSVVPLVSQPAPTAAIGNVYVADVMSVDSTNAAGIDLVLIFEPTVGVPY